MHLIWGHPFTSNSKYLLETKRKSLKKNAFILGLILELFLIPHINFFKGKDQPVSQNNQAHEETSETWQREAQLKWQQKQTHMLFIY